MLLHQTSYPPLQKNHVFHCRGRVSRPEKMGGETPPLRCDFDGFPHYRGCRGGYQPPQVWKLPRGGSYPPLQGKTAFLITWSNRVFQRRDGSAVPRTIHIRAVGDGSAVPKGGRRNASPTVGFGALRKGRNRPEKRWSGRRLIAAPTGICRVFHRSGRVCRPAKTQSVQSIGASP